MSLSLLPPEVLSVVTAHLAAKDIMHMWFCGDSRINHRLANGGVTRIHSLNTFRGTIPHYLNYFQHLDELLVSSFAVADETDRGFILSPETLLRKISFSSPCNSSSIGRAALSTIAAFDLNHVEELRIQRCNIRDSDLPVITNNLPNLTSLSLVNSGGWPQPSQLPRSLIHLELSDLLHSWTHSQEYAHLPPNLESLSLTMHNFCYPSVPLPASLRTLQMVHVYGGAEAIHLDAVAMLPRNLTKLIAPFAGRDSIALLAVIQALPPALNYLKLTDATGWTMTHLEALPRGLKSFDQAMTISGDPIAFLQSLPPTLTDNVLWSVIPGDLVDHLPRGTTRVETKCPCGSLPPGLTDLTINHLDESITAWPTHLAALLVRHPANMALFNILPKTLTSLELTLGPGYDFFSNLPSSLTKLTVSTHPSFRAPVTRDQLASLPLFLRRFSLSRFVIDDFTVISSLPRFIEDVMIHLDPTTPLCDNDGVIFENHRLLRSLKISFDFTYHAKLYDRIFHHLPPNVETMTLQTFDKMLPGAECLEHLPKSLRNLELPALSEQLPTADLARMTHMPESIVFGFFNMTVKLRERVERYRQTQNRL